MIEFIHGVFVGSMVTFLIFTLFAGRQISKAYQKGKQYGYRLGEDNVSKFVVDYTDNLEEKE